MNIGIVGFGKMGSEIFDLIHGLSSADSIVVVSDTDIEQPAEKIIKNLDKSLRRKRITEEEYERRKNSFRFSHDVSDLGECDLVIECIYEDMNAKKSLFKEISSSVSGNCILATNTSSLSIDEIFENVTERPRCTGFHFFYPVKFSEYIELNVTDQTSEEVISVLTGLVTEAGKKPVVFRGQYHIYLNQYISYCISAGLMITEKTGCGILNGKEILSDMFPMHGLFGMADSIGLKLLTTNENNFSISRIKRISDYGTEFMTGLLNSGCSGETGKLFEYLENENKEYDTFCDPSSVKADMAAFVLNEAVSAADDSGCGKDLISALESAVGLDRSMSDYYKEYGYVKIKERISYYGETAADREIFDRYL